MQFIGNKEKGQKFYETNSGSALDLKPFLPSFFLSDEKSATLDSIFF